MANLYPNNVIDMVGVLPPDQSVLIRGPHGIGKSQIAKEVGRGLGRPVIDLRLSQMTEGDFLGLPKIVEPEFDANGVEVKRGMTTFRAPEWFVKAQDEPHVLLLDEINRAVPEVMQCAFQLVLDRAIHGKDIHPETVIIAAINATHHYQVNEMDPALLDRFLVVDMIPNIKPWKDWAQRSGIDGSIIEFCTENVDHWWHDPKKNLEPGKVYPTPRAWEMVNNCLRHGDLFGKFTQPVFRHICQGLVGDEAGAMYYDFIKNYERNISAEHILDRYDEIAQRVKRGLATEQVMNITDKLVQHSVAKKWKESQVKNLQRFMQDVENGELVFSLWNKLQSKGREGKKPEANALMVHRVCQKEIAQALRVNRIGPSNKK